MKRYCFLLIILFSACFFSCSDDEDDKVINSNIIGKWQLVLSSDKETEPCLFKGYCEFISNGTYKDKTSCNINGDGKWELKGNSLIITVNMIPIPVTATVKSLTDEELILELEGIGWSNGDVTTIKYTDTYKRIY